MPASNIYHADPGLLTRLRQVPGSSARADIAVGYFFVSGFAEVVDDLAKLNKTRVLMGRADRPTLDAVAAGLRAQLDAAGQSPAASGSKPPPKPCKGGGSAGPGPQPRRFSATNPPERGHAGQSPAVHPDLGTRTRHYPDHGLIAGYEGEFVIAGKGYDSGLFRQSIVERSMTPVIPPRSNRKEPHEYDVHLYRERHPVECFINRIKQFRRIFSRFEKLDARYLAFLHFAGALIWLR